MKKLYSLVYPTVAILSLAAAFAARADAVVDTYREGCNLTEMFAAKAAGWDEMFREDSGAFYLSQQRPAADANHVMAAGPTRRNVK